MGRNPKLRINFDSDVQYLLRLKHALEEDKSYPEDYREEVCGKVVELTRTLLAAPPRKEAKAEQTQPKRRRA